MVWLSRSGHAELQTLLSMVCHGMFKPPLPR